MKCPKCGTEIKDGYMYCSKCGEEIIMVPDYEVELEVGIEQTISEVAEMMADSVEVLNTEDSAVMPDPVETAEESEISPKPPKLNSIKKTGPRILAVVAVILGLLFVFGIYRLLTFINDYYSYDKQFDMAKTQYDAGEYEAAIKTARHVITLNKKDERPRLILADSYYELKKYDESIAVLNDLLDDFPQDITVYERLLKEYEIEGDTDSIMRLAERGKAAGISDMFEKYAPQTVEFDLEEGTYSEPQEVRLLSTGDGTIYYTLDGTEPTMKSAAYTEPIILGEGETVVTAVCVNNKGVMGEPVSRTYSVTEAFTIEIPELLTASGDYSIPELIKLKEPSEGSIFYTTDGSDPNADSNKYEPPVPMPLGKSEFRFAVINESGIAGDVVVAEYNLTIKGVFDSEYAKNAVQLSLMAHGHPVMDHEFSVKYGYSNNGRSYYIVEEYAAVDGKKQRQNTVYAVDSQTGEVFTINRNTEKGDYDFGIVT